MKIANIEFEHPYILNKNINYIIIENKNKFYEYTTEILNQFNGLNGRFVLSKNNEEISFAKKSFIIDNLLNIDFTNKKITNKLYQLIDLNVNQNFVEEFNQIKQNVVSFLHDISLDNDFEFEFNDTFDVASILKAVDFRIEDSSINLIEKIITYLNVIILLFNPKIILIYNLRVWLSNEDCLELYKFARYNDLKLLILESKAYEKIDNENFFIIDNDLCELTF